MAVNDFIADYLLEIDALAHHATELTCAESETNLVFESILSLLDIAPEDSVEEIRNTAGLRLARLSNSIRHEVSPGLALKTLLESPGWPLVRKLTIVKSQQASLSTMVQPSSFSHIESIVMDGDIVEPQDIQAITTCSGQLPHLKCLYFASGLTESARRMVESLGTFTHLPELRPAWDGMLRSPNCTELESTGCIFSEQMIDALDAHTMLSAVDLRIPLHVYNANDVRKSLEAHPGVCGKVSSLTIESDSNHANIAELLSHLPLNGLKKLRISGEEADIDGMERFPALAGLADLVLDIRDLGNAGWKFLRNWNLDSLRTLTLSHTSGGDEGVHAIAANRTMIGLKRLNLNGNIIGPNGVAKLSSSPVFENLELLELDGNPIGDDGITTLATSSQASTLRTLSISNAGDGGLRGLSESVYLRGLRKLFISCKSVSNEQIELFARSKALDNLLRLTIGFVEAENANSFLSTQDLRGLRSLELIGEIKDMGVVALARTETLNSLLELNLNYSDVSEEGMSHLVTSPEQLRLVRLGILGGRLTESSSQMLAESGKFPCLRHLTINRNLMRPWISSPYTLPILKARLQYLYEMDDS